MNISLNVFVVKVLQYRLQYQNSFGISCSRCLYCKSTSLFLTCSSFVRNCFEICQICSQISHAPLKWLVSFHGGIISFQLTPLVFRNFCSLYLYLIKNSASVNLYQFLVKQPKKCSLYDTKRYWRRNCLKTTLRRRMR